MVSVRSAKPLQSGRATLAGCAMRLPHAPLHSRAVPSGHPVCPDASIVATGRVRVVRRLLGPTLCVGTALRRSAARTGPADVAIFLARSSSNACCFATRRRAAKSRSHAERGNEELHPSSLLVFLEFLGFPAFGLGRIFELLRPDFDVDVHARKVPRYLIVVGLQQP